MIRQRRWHKGKEQASGNADATMLETEEKRTKTSMQRDEISSQDVPSAKKTATSAHRETFDTDKVDVQKAMPKDLEAPVTPEHTPRAWHEGNTGVKVKDMVTMVNARAEASGNKSPSIRSSTSNKDNDSEPSKMGRASTTPLPFRPSPAGG